MNRSEEVALLLEQKIRSGEISGKLPSEKELAAGFAVANMTMARAMDILKAKLRYTSLQRHLSSLKTNLMLIT